MTWMNEWDVQDAVDHYTQRSFNTVCQPNATTAALALAGLMEWTNDNSDGWPYWSKPSNAAKRLQEYLSGWRKRFVEGDDSDLTDAELTALLRPVKAFLTRHGADWREVLS